MAKKGAEGSDREEVQIESPVRKKRSSDNPNTPSKRPRTQGIKRKSPHRKQLKKKKTTWSAEIDKRLLFRPTPRMKTSMKNRKNTICEDNAEHLGTVELVGNDMRVHLKSQIQKRNDKRSEMTLLGIGYGNSTSVQSHCLSSKVENLEGKINKWARLMSVCDEMKEISRRNGATSGSGKTDALLAFAYDFGAFIDLHEDQDIRTANLSAAHCIILCIPFCFQHQHSKQLACSLMHRDDDTVERQCSKCQQECDKDIGVTILMHTSQFLDNPEQTILEELARGGDVFKGSDVIATTNFRLVGNGNNNESFVPSCVLHNAVISQSCPGLPDFLCAQSIILGSEIPCMEACSAMLDTKLKQHSTSNFLNEFLNNRPPLPKVDENENVRKLTEFLDVAMKHEEIIADNHSFRFSELLLSLQRCDQLLTKRSVRQYGCFEFALLSPMQIALDDETFHIECTICKQKCTSGGYSSLYAAVMDCLTRVCFEHRLLGRGVTRANFSKIFQLDRSIVPDSLPAVVHCKPDGRVHNSCLGDDFLVTSSICNEQQADVDSCTTPFQEICMALMMAEKHFFTLETSLKAISDNDRVELRDFFPIKFLGGSIEIFDTPVDESPIADEEESLRDEEGVLLPNAIEVLCIDWNDPQFLIHQPRMATSSVTPNDVAGINQNMASNKMTLHHFGIHELWMEEAKKSHSQTKCNKDKLYTYYERIPEIAHSFAFQKGNGCTDVFTDEGRRTRVRSRLYLVRSRVRMEGKKTCDIVEHMRSCTCYNVSNADAGYVFIEWRVDEILVNRFYCYDVLRIELETLPHLVWTKISSNFKQELLNHYEGRLFEDRPQGFHVHSLFPYQATARFEKTSSMPLGFAMTKIMASDLSRYGSFPHGRLLDVIINPTFLYHATNTTDATTNTTLNSTSVAGRETTTKTTTVHPSCSNGIKSASVVTEGGGCAPPLGSLVDDCVPLTVGLFRPFVEEVNHVSWNCKKGNILNLLSFMGLLTSNLAAYIKRAEQHCNICKLLKDNGYNVFRLQVNGDYDSVVALAQEINLPIWFYGNMSMRRDIHYGHYFGIAPYWDDISCEFSHAIIDGSHESFGPLELTASCIRWCMSGFKLSALAEFEVYAFFPAKKQSRLLLKEMADQYKDFNGAICLEPSVLRNQMKSLNNVVADRGIDHYRCYMQK